MSVLKPKDNVNDDTALTSARRNKRREQRAMKDQKSNEPITPKRGQQIDGPSEGLIQFNKMLQNEKKTDTAKREKTQRVSNTNPIIPDKRQSEKASITSTLDKEIQ